MNELIAKGLLIAGKALLHIMPTVLPRPEETEPDELDLFIDMAILLAVSDTFQVLNSEEQQRYHHHMAEIVKLFIEDDDDDGDNGDDNDLPPDGPDAVKMAEDVLKSLALV